MSATVTYVGLLILSLAAIFCVINAEGNIIIICDIPASVVNDSMACCKESNGGSDCDKAKLRELDGKKETHEEMLICVAKLWKIVNENGEYDSEVAIEVIDKSQTTTDSKIKKQFLEEIRKCDADNSEVLKKLDCHENAFYETCITVE